MLNLSIKIFWHFFKNNKLLVGFLCLIQIISIFASLFVFSYFEAIQMQIKNMIVLRPILYRLMVHSSMIIRC